MRSFYLSLVMTIFTVCSALAQPFPPTIPASSINYTAVDGGSVRILWTIGNGARRIVVVRQGAAVTALPVNGVDYNPSAVFGSGDAILPGQFVVYDNTSSFVDLSGLQPGTTYHVAIFEYNGSASTTQYLTANFPVSNLTTVSAPTTATSNIAASSITGSAMTVSWTNGNGGRRLVLARPGTAVNANPTDLTLYTASQVYGLGGQIGTGNYVLLSGTQSSVNVSGLQPSTTYHYSIFEYNGISGPVYLIPGSTANFTTGPRPTVAATNLSFNSVDGTSMRALWSNGNGSRRIIVARAGSAVTALPLDGIDYASSAVFGSGDDLGGGQFVVYDGNSSFVDLSGLSSATTYHFRVYEYDGSGTTTAYLTSSFLSGSQATVSTPTVATSNLNFTNLAGSSVTVNWTNGNGSRRLLVMRSGSAVNADPTNLTAYVSSTVFGAGNQIGTGNYCVANQTIATVNITGLSISTTYHVAVYEFNGASQPMYLVPGSTGSFTTPATPTNASSNLIFQSIEGNSMRLNWTSGNGQRRIIVARAGSAVTATPTDGIDYTHNASFGSGDDLGGGQFVVYDGITSFGDITGLNPATIYHYRIYEYNGTGVNTSYLTGTFASGNQTTLVAPVTPTSGITFSNVSGSNVRITWTNGNGSGRLLLMRQGSAVNTDPSNLTVYSPSTIFGSGAEVGTGNFSVFRSTLNNVNVTNLLPNTTYHVAAYEYNGSTGPVFRVPGVTASFTTAAQPTIASSAITFLQVEGNAMRLSWTNGSGARRIVVARAGSAVTAIPTNGIDYTSSPAFGNGDDLGSGQFVVFDGTASFFDINSLLSNTTYHFAIFEYDGTGTGTAYMTSSFASASQSTVITPTIQASNLAFSAVAGNTATVGWTLGNGQNRIVVVRQGSPVTTEPSDFSLYASSANFGLGAQIGAGNYVLYRGTGSSVAITNLLPGTTYYFAIFEYNGSSAPVYLKPGLTGSLTTLGAPTVQATSATVGSITPTTLQLNWVSGSGNRRLVLIRPGAAVDGVPIDNGTYTANSAFGAGTLLGVNNYVVYNGTGNSVLVTGLTGGTTYHFAVYEFNSFGAGSQFLTASPATSSATTNASVPVRFLSFTITKEVGSARLDWSTAQEANSARFNIERSGNGRDYESIGSLHAAGNSTSIKKYQFVDRQPLKGTAFYRIRQIDLDGTFTFSRVLTISSKFGGIIVRMMNPVQQQIWIEISAVDPQVRTEWKMFDQLGKMVHKGIVSGNIIETNWPSALPAGIYVVEISQGDKMERVRIMKN